MRFNEVLELHRSAQAEHSFSDILGDAYLLNENPIYSRVREQAVKLDIGFTEATTQYLLMPFNSLDSILSSKKVPFVPAARLMAEVESRQPGVFDLEQMPMPESYHLHECAHVIAEHFCSGITITGQRDHILKSILCESFANTVDALACSYANSDAHRTFIKLNCYMNPSQENRDLIHRVRDTHGEEFTARLTLLSYVFANFLQEEVPSEFIGSDSEDCVALSQLGQQLDPLFRVRTTENYFRLQGFQGEIYDLLAFDFMKRLERQDFTSAIPAMIKSIIEIADDSKPAG